MSDWDDDNGYEDDSLELSGELGFGSDAMSIVTDDDLDMGDGDDAAAQFLAGAEAGASVYGEKTPRILHNAGAMDSKEKRLSRRRVEFHEDEGTLEQLDDAYVGATPFDLQLSTVQAMEPRVQRGFKDLLSGGSLKGVSNLEAIAAKQAFEKAIGASGEDFAARIKVHESVGSPNHPADIHRVMSITGGVDASLDRGPGSMLPGNYLSSGSEATITGEAKKQLKDDEDFAQAQEYLKEITGVFIPEETIGSPVEGARRLAVSEKLHQRLLEGVFYDGSTSMLPVPREVGVPGLVRTQGIYASPQGTRHTRLSAAGQYDWAYETNAAGKFVRDNKGYRVMKPGVSQEDKTRILQGTPGLANSLFPIAPAPRGETRSQEMQDSLRREQQYKMADLQWKAEFYRKTVRKRFPTMRDESANQMNMAGFDRPYDEQELQSQLRDEAAILGHEWGETYADSTVDGVNNDLLSPQEEYVQERMEDGTSLAQVIAAEESVSDFVGPPVMSDRDKYLHWAEGAPKQRTPAWFAQRKGLVTGSIAGKLTTAASLSKLAGDMAESRIDPTSNVFEGNSDTEEGKEFEQRALNSFKAKFNDQFDVEEGFFETNKDFPGIGASPDGRVFNKDGTSAGLLELKLLTGKRMEPALRKYMKQMQMQMLASGEEKTHFYAMNKHTGDFAHEVVYADKKLQEKLYAKARGVIDTADNLTAEEVIAMRQQVELARPTEGDPANVQGLGQTTAFNPSTASPEVIVPYRPGAHQASQATSDSVLARVAERITANANRGHPEQPGDAIAALYKIKKEDLSAGGLGSDNLNEAHKEALQEEIRLKKESIAAQKKLNSAANSASDNIARFASGAGRAAGVFGELGGVLLQGGESGRDTILFGREHGYDDADKVRGLENMFRVEGGLKVEETRGVLAAASRVSATFQSPTKIPQAAKDVARNWSALRGRAGPMPTLGQLAMPPQQLLAMVQERTKDLSPMDKKLALQAIDPGLAKLAMADVSGEDISNANSRMNEEGILEFFSGSQWQQVLEQELKEEGAAESGYTGGVISQGAQAVDSIINSKTVQGAAGLGATLYGAKKLKNLAGRGAIRQGGGQGARSLALRAAAAGSRLGPGALAAGSAGLAGYAVGSAIYEGIDDKPVGDMLGRGIAEIMALAGSDDAQNALDRMDNYEKIIEASGGPTRSRGRGRNRRRGSRSHAVDRMTGLDQLHSIDAIPNTVIEDPMKVSDYETPEINTVNNIELNVSVDPSMVSSDITVNGEDYSNEDRGYV